MELWIGKHFWLEGNVSDGSGPADTAGRYSRVCLSLYSCGPNGLESLQISGNKHVRRFHSEGLSD